MRGPGEWQVRRLSSLVRLSRDARGRGAAVLGAEQTRRGAVQERGRGRHFGLQSRTRDVSRRVGQRGRQRVDSRARLLALSNTARQQGYVRARHCLTRIIVR